MKHTYTHKDKDGMRWRFEGGRPISELADEITKPPRLHMIKEVIAEYMAHIVSYGLGFFGWLIEKLGLGPK